MQNEQQKEVLFAGLSARPSQYRACVAQVRGTKATVLKAYSVSKEVISWRDFVKSIRQDFPGHSIVTAMGFDDSCVGFYCIEVPAVNEKQLQALIAVQAEIHLPLPMEQMEFCWRVLGQHEGKTTVAIAAAKRDMLSEVVGLARQANVDAIVLRSEAVLRTIASRCEGLGADYALLCCRQDDTKLLFVQNGILAKAATLDCEFSEMTDADASEASLLCLDIQNVISEYMQHSTEPLRFYLDGSDRFIEIIEKVLNEKDIGTSRIRYDLNQTEGDDGSTPDIECLGLALTVHDAGPQYDVFNGVYQKHSSESKETTGRKKVLAAVVCFMLAVFIAVSYGIDKLRLAVYEKEMDTPEFSRLLETHRLRSTIARERIDIPDLIETINGSIPKGVTVHSLQVRRYQKIAVGGACKDPKMMYSFAEALGKCKGVEGVRPSNQDFDDKKKQTTFTLLFDYKNVTDKRKKAE
ncbi:MAG: hypothetical protein ACYSOZ_03965 [Planctomycetota bacterium]|jgi:hypothetical protein